jgi:hypothetical protein
MFKFPPFLTEQWASAYFQILFSALVFAIGIPFLGLQLVMQEDVRHVVTYRQWKMLIWALLVFLLFMSAVSFIWYLHPAQMERRAAEQRVKSGNAEAQPSPAANTEGQPPAAEVDPDEQSYAERVVAALIVTVIPMAALIFGYWLPINYTRKKVIQQFKGDLISSFDKNKTLKKETLMKLVYLGDHGNAGIEKGLVLKAFTEIAHHVQKSTNGYQYKGRELADMVRAIKTVVEEGEKRGNDENYKEAAGLLRLVWTKVTGDHSTQDATLAASVLKHLGLTAVKERSEETANLYVMFGAECDDSVVFELGLAAFNAKRYRVATLALGKLEMLALNENGRELRNTETVSNLLGLLAQYSFEGISAKKRATQFLLQTKDLFSPSLQACVESATSYHYNAGSFDTADKIMKLSEALNPPQTARQPWGSP